jgi:hypothetical protein
MIEPRMDMLVPHNSNLFITGNVLRRGINLDALFVSITADGRVTALLTRIGQETLAQWGGGPDGG